MYIRVAMLSHPTFILSRSGGCRNCLGNTAACGGVDEGFDGWFGPRNVSLEMTGCKPGFFRQQVLPRLRSSMAFQH
jgi:hypothetical protein